MIFDKSSFRTFMIYGALLILIIALVVFGGPSMGINSAISIIFTIMGLVFFSPIIILILTLIGMGIDFFYKKLFTRTT
jgi:hypothetical protein